MELGVHIVSHGRGESIVLELPDQTVGVIDTFLARSKGRQRSPTAAFIRQHLPNRDLRFLAITHPHADHCRGVCQLIGELEPERQFREFWMFHAFTVRVLHDYFREFDKEFRKSKNLELARKNVVDRALGLQPTDVPKELLRLEEYIEREARAKRARAKGIRFSTAIDLMPGPPHVRVRVLTPGFEILGSNDYVKQMERALRARAAGPQALEGSSFPSIDHNLASTAILVECGQTALLFMADAEEPMWRELFRAMAEQSDLTMPSVQLVKISHHGSLNGYSQELFNKVCDRNKTLAVVTPFTKQGLPSREGIDRIRQHTHELLCTNGAAACWTSQLYWAPYAESLPEQLISLLLQNRPVPELPPQVRRNLIPRRGMARQEVYDFLQRPGLLQNFDQYRLNTWVTDERENIETDFRVSLYFDEQGRELKKKRFMGSGVGRLVPLDISPA